MICCENIVNVVVFYHKTLKSRTLRYYIFTYVNMLFSQFVLMQKLFFMKNILFVSQKYFQEE